jgi:hypothetical protein
MIADKFTLSFENQMRLAMEDLVQLFEALAAER